MINNKYIPFEVEGDYNWYMDVSNLSLSELIKLRDLLSGTVSYRHIDGIIYELSNISVDSFHDLNKRGYQRVRAKSKHYIPKSKHKRR